MLRDTLGRRTSDQLDDLLMNTPVSVDERPDHQNDLNDDVFGSAPASPILGGGDEAPARQTTEHSDIHRLRSTHVTNGYREGIAVSKEEYIQAGFDEGFSLGGEIGLKAGWLLGVLEGIRKALVKASRSDGADDEAKKCYVEAQEELKMEKLLGREYFNEEGVSLFGVSLREGQTEDEVTYADIAAAHPVLVRWDGKVRELAGKVQLGLKNQSSHSPPA